MTSRSAALCSITIRKPARGFSLVELLVVVLILVIVLAVVLPALGGARNSARKADTETLFAQLSSAITQFEIDTRRLPGYFSPSEMGDSENETRGFTNMENIMLDLAGGIVDGPAVNGNNNPSDPINGPSVVEVGPTAADTVFVDIKAIGASRQTGTGATVKGYFTPEAKRFVAQAVAGQQVSNQIGIRALPDVLDGFGDPILAWVQDAVPGDDVDFAINNSDAGRARYYWASNAGFLKSTSLGKIGADQNGSGDQFSMIGVRSPNSLATDSLTGLLGNRAFPVANSNPARPAAARAPIVLHSAGANGVFLGSDERGGKASGDTRTFTYDPNQPNALDGFDDVVRNVGN